jgi:hypothetical protein
MWCWKLVLEQVRKRQMAPVQLRLPQQLVQLGGSL